MEQDVSEPPYYSACASDELASTPPQPSQMPTRTPPSISPRAAGTARHSAPLRPGSYRPPRRGEVAVWEGASTMRARRADAAQPLRALAPSAVLCDDICARACCRMQTTSLCSPKHLAGTHALSLSLSLALTHTHILSQRSRIHQWCMPRCSVALYTHERPV